MLFNQDLKNTDFLNKETIVCTSLYNIMNTSITSSFRTLRDVESE